MTKNKEDAIICLAAGSSQKKLILSTQALGYKVVAVDRDPKADCSGLVDHFICQSTYDAPSVIKELKKLSSVFEWKGVLNRSAGPPVITAAEISKFFNLPGVPVDSSKSIVNKDLLRTRCSVSQIPIPKFRILTEFEWPTKDPIDLPLVIKPSLSLVGKSGISIVSSKKNLKKAFLHAKKNSINGKVLFEEYLPGPDISFVSFVLDEELIPIIVLDEINIESESGLVLSHGYRVHDPSSEGNLPAEAEEISVKLKDLFKIQRSPFMTCFRVAKDKSLKLIEIHLDLGGDLLIEELFPRALSFDYSKYIIEMCIGEKSNIEVIKPKPVAIFYEQGKELLRQRDFKIFEANNHESLKGKIRKAGL